MKRVIMILAAAVVVLSSCKKEEIGSYTYRIDASATVDDVNHQTVVTFSSTYEQAGVQETPRGNALLIFSATRDMIECETLRIKDYPFSGGEGRFVIPGTQRAVSVAYWYVIELYAPLSKPLRSEVFEMPVTTVPTGGFVLEDGKCVMFAKGNLQYNAVAGRWRFAEQQYEVIGAENGSISQTYDGYIDLFGYGTSGYNYNAWASELNVSLYATGDICGTKKDWGVYCDIDGGSWRTLKSSEWEYIYAHRPFAAERRSRATVNGVKGLVLLPDVWDGTGFSFTADASTYGVNIYTANEWSVMESEGAVFLPATGYRIGTAVNGLDEGNYHSSSWTEHGTSEGGSEYCAQPVRFVFNESKVFSHAIYSGTEVYNAYGSAVRLVREMNL